MTPKTLWHYTDNAGAHGILTSNTLWATSMSHLNDTGELEYGLDLALQEIEVLYETSGTSLTKEFYGLLRDEVEAAKGSDRFYVACASTKEDDLSQWRAYGRGGGYALGIATPDKESWWVPYMPEPHQVAVTMETIFERLTLGRWIPVEYREDEQRQLLRSIVEYSDETLGTVIARSARDTFPNDNDSAIRDVASAVSKDIVLQVLFFKQAAFEGENECRLVLADPGVDNIVQFRSGPFGITPYLRITPGNEPRRTTALDAELIPLSAVTVGPSAHALSAKRGIERLLRNQHLTGVEVKISSATYRDA